MKQQNVRRMISVMAMTGVIAITSLTVFGQESKKTADARKDVVKAQKNLTTAQNNLREARIDSASDYQDFINQAALKINDNEQRIIKLKEESQGVKERYDNKVLALEQQNIALKKRISDSETTKTSSWSSFKHEFNYDMDVLWNSIKDMGVNNTK